MKTKYYIFGVMWLLIGSVLHAQKVTTVTANRSDISDNLDLRAVASIFGDSRDLQDFEYKLNDPKNQISNLDLNYDRKVDYLRVIEVVENNTHLIILQAILDKDIYQDVATIEVERDRYNNVQIQVVGDPYFYGSNYIYEPVYVSRPAIYNVFWVNTYRPYYSSYYWNYYPSFYYGWRPFPVYAYRKNIHVHINVHNNYNYVNTRRSSQAIAMYNTRRSNGYEKKHPNTSFAQRNQVSNRYELETSRNNISGQSRNATTRNLIAKNTTARSSQNVAVKSREANTAVTNTARNTVRTQDVQKTSKDLSNNIQTNRNQLSTNRGISVDKQSANTNASRINSPNTARNTGSGTISTRSQTTVANPPTQNRTNQNTGSRNPAQNSRNLGGR